MIVEILPSSIEYLLGDRDCNGNHRPSMIVDGCYATFMSEYAKAKKYSHPYLTFCLRDPKPLCELGGQQFLTAIINDFKKHILPGFDNDQVQCLAIMHDNTKHDFELNLLMLQQVNNRKVGMYYDRIARPYFKTFGEFIHRKYLQLTSPNQRDLIRDLADPNKFWETKQQELYDVICAYAKPCKLNNRKEFVDLLRNHLQLNVNEKSPDSLVVSDRHTAIKLRGNLCQSDFSRRERESSMLKSDEQIYAEYIKSAHQYHHKLLTKYKFLKEIINNESYIKQNVGTTDKQHVANNTQTHNYRVAKSRVGIDQIDINRDERSIARPERSTTRAGDNSKRSDKCDQVVDRAKQAISRVSERCQRYDKVVQELRIAMGRQAESNKHTNDKTEITARNFGGKNSSEDSVISSITTAIDDIAKVLEQIIRPQRKSIIAEIIELLDTLFAPPPVQKVENKAKPTPPPPPAKQEEVQVCKVKLEVAPTEFQTKVKLYQSEIMQCEWGKAIHGQEQINELMLTIVNAIKQNVVLDDIKQCQTFSEFKNLVYPNQQRSKSPWFDL